MVRLLFFASLLLIIGKLLFQPGHRPAEITIRVPSYALAGAAPVRIAMSTRATSFLQNCAIRAKVVVERRIAGAWYTHRRLVRGQCEYDRHAGRFPDRGTNVRLPITMPGTYRVLVFYREPRDARTEVALSNAFEVRAPRAPALAGTFPTP